MAEELGKNFISQRRIRLAQDGIAEFPLDRAEGWQTVSSGETDSPAGQAKPAGVEETCARREDFEG